MTMFLAQQMMRDFWFREANSDFADRSDWIYLAILWICIFFFVLLMVLMTYFVIKYRRRPGVAPQRSASHNTPLELTWSIIPLLILVVIFFWGFHGFVETLANPAGAEEIRITGYRWGWTAEYSNGAVPRDTVSIGNIDEVPVIAVPAGRPVRIVMTSTDVMHSFFIPAFRIKMDLFPNRYTSMWFEPREAGHDHIVFCAEYCGDRHSEMYAVIRTVEPEQFNRLKREWAGPDPDASPVERGRFNARRYGCFSCHTVDGSPATGPTWLNNYGYEREMQDGTTRVMDENYVREAVYNPRAFGRVGYPIGQMNSYQGLIDEEALYDIIMYIRSLSDRGGVETDEANATNEAGGDQPG